MSAGCRVYVLQNSEGRFYIGITDDVARRIGQHNAGESRRFGSTHAPSRRFLLFRNAFAFLAAATSLTCGRKNSCWHGELVGPGFCRAVVSQEDAGERAARLVRAALRIGRGKLDVLFRAGTENGRALVRDDAS